MFFWVARLGGFNRAAERLATTQPAVSQRIAGLEREFGVKLIERRPRSVALTPKGRELFDYAERLMRLHSEMVTAVASPAAKSGVVRLGVAETIVHTWLADYVEKIHVAYPKITLDIEVDVSPKLRDGLVEGSLDLAFLLGPVSAPRLSNVELCRYPLSFVARAGLDLGPEPVPLARLVTMPVITYSKATRPYVTVRELLSRSNLEPPRIYASSSLSTIVRMTLDGIGVSVIPAAVIGAELARGDLRVVRSDVELPHLVFTATYALGPDGSLVERLTELAVEVARTARRSPAQETA